MRAKVRQHDASVLKQIAGDAGWRRGQNLLLAPFRRTATKRKLDSSTLRCQTAIFGSKATD